MKIATNSSYGWVEQISISERPTPRIKSDEVLIKVAYSSVNRTDLGFLKGQPLATRLFAGLFRPRYSTLGCEFAGTISQVGQQVTGFNLGDEVFGYDDRGGGHAEYKVMRPTKMLTTLPENVRLAEAAISTEGSHYALGFMNKVDLRGDQTVFVHGATGGIGSAMVQLLAARGVRVVASSTTDCLEAVRGLGAAEVIDWQTTPLASLTGQYDHFFDAVGKTSPGAVRHLLKPGGAYISSEVGKNWQNVWLSIFNRLQKIITRRNVLFPIPSNNKRLMEEIRQHLATKSFQPLLDREYLLDDIKLAYQYVETGHKKGNVRIRVQT